MQVEPFGTIDPGAGILSVLLVAFAAKALRIIPDRMRKSPQAVSLAMGVFITVFAPAEQGRSPLPMGIGVIVHVSGTG
ncbi:uncharacterized membrane protein YoaK (UPF0700 family) [Arthrobacter sp. B3I9]|uniref:hypothetical protein n=1 Tax=Arthrobacter sp. B3I9 TaxID=3042270 RepID=UPI00278CE2DA|nr:hypothetical protein [Arthrobacter sp. B3I9]MDQ0850666.1 uncharacterized membrane protein YoaK (UPF0700 family) [Arthrobacter sp. B3I9]